MRNLKMNICRLLGGARVIIGSALVAVGMLLFPKPSSPTLKS